jgi:hypothetical protein
MPNRGEQTFSNLGRSRLAGLGLSPEAESGPLLSASDFSGPLGFEKISVEAMETRDLKGKS